LGSGLVMTGLILLFASGATALVYEVLWLRQLSLLFGSTAASAAICLAAFFAGMSLGQAVAASRCSRAENPLWLYGVLEIVAGGLALAVLALPQLYTALVAGWVGDELSGSSAPAVARALLSLAVLGLPAAVLGATFPFVVEAEARRNGATATSLYVANTLGGVAGALLASFFLLPWFGLRGSYWMTVAASTTIGLAAIAVSRDAAGEVGAARTDAVLPWSGRLALIAFSSGALALAAEVLWTRMLVQVLHNSVYSFALVLATVLVSLALGGLIVRGWCRRAAPRDAHLAVVALVAGVGLTLSALVFIDRTDGMAYAGGAAGWLGYLGEVSLLAASVIVLPGAVAGMLLPLALELGRARVGGGGRVAGWLVAANTVGAVLGSLVAGFVLLPSLGLWSAVRWVSVAYAALAVLALPRPATVGALAVACLVIFGPFAGRELRRVDIGGGDELLEVVDGAGGTVAAVRRGEVVSIRLNNSYTVGTNANIVNDRRKADLPILIHPSPRSVLFIGMGAGITAAAALAHPVEEVVTCEIVPAVAELTRRHLAGEVGALFEDPRSRVVIADGRQALAHTEQKFDVIVGDLFVPWHAGTANLYSREHFANVAARLTAEGVFAQWLPLYQMSRRELDIVARTMSEVFPRVTLWRGDFRAETPSVALFGHASRFPLDLADVLRNVRLRIGDHEADDAVTEALALIFYAGNVTQSSELFADAPINTEDRPVLEHVAPRTQRAVKSGAANWLNGRELVRLYRELEGATPPRHDYYLARLDDRQLDYQRAGLDLYELFVAPREGDEELARQKLESFRRRAPARVVEMFEALMQ